MTAHTSQMITLTANNTSAAIQSVSATMSPTGRQPTANSALKEVFMPSAAIAATRHQRETSFARSIATFGNNPMELTTTRTAKPTKNIGKVAFALSPGPLFRA